MGCCGPLELSPFCDGRICDCVTLGSGEGLFALLPCLEEEVFFIIAASMANLQWPQCSVLV